MAKPAFDGNPKKNHAPSFLLLGGREEQKKVVIPRFDSGAKLFGGLQAEDMQV